MRFGDAPVRKWYIGFFGGYALFQCKGFTVIVECAFVGFKGEIKIAYVRVGVSIHVWIDMLKIRLSFQVIKDSGIEIARIKVNITDLIVRKAHFIMVFSTGCQTKALPKIIDGRIDGMLVFPMSDSKFIKCCIELFIIMVVNGIATSAMKLFKMHFMCSKYVHHFGNRLCRLLEQRLGKTHCPGTHNQT